MGGLESGWEEPRGSGLHACKRVQRQGPKYRLCDWLMPLGTAGDPPKKQDADDLAGPPSFTARYAQAQQPGKPRRSRTARFIIPRSVTVAFKTRRIWQQRVGGTHAQFYRSQMIEQAASGRIHDVCTGWRT